MSSSPGVLRRHRVAIGIVVIVTVVLLSGVIAVAADESGVVRPTSSSDQAPNQAASNEIYGGHHAYVSDGHGGIAGWIDPMQLGGSRDPAVYNNDGIQVGYWVDNLGFVDLAAHDSPSYDPNALRVARLGPDAVKEIDRLKADLDTCLQTHTAPFCAEQAGG